MRFFYIENFWLLQYSGSLKYYQIEYFYYGIADFKTYVLMNTIDRYIHLSSVGWKT